MNNNKELDAINQKIKAEADIVKEQLKAVFATMFERSRNKSFNNCNKDLKASVNFLLDLIVMQTLEMRMIKKELDVLK